MHLFIKHLGGNPKGTDASGICLLLAKRVVVGSAGARPGLVSSVFQGGGRCGGAELGRDSEDWAWVVVEPAVITTTVSCVLLQARQPEALDQPNSWSRYELTPCWGQDFTLGKGTHRTQQ